MTRISGIPPGRRPHVPVQAMNERTASGIVSRAAAHLRSPGVREASALLLFFASLLALMPIRTAIQLGADEGFEVGKATELLHGFKLYAEVWNDHPPLHTLVIAQALRCLGHSILWPRLVSILAAMVVVASVFRLAFCCFPTRGQHRTRAHTAAMAAFFLILSPGFLELSSSC